MIVTALLGMPGSGKTTAAEHLMLMGVPVYRLGSIVVAEVETRSLPLTPENEAIVRMELREKFGSTFMASSAIEWVNNLSESILVVLDGVYSLAEYDRLAVEYGHHFKVLAVVSDREVRRSRLVNRKDRPLSQTEATNRDRHELEHLHKGDPIALADHYLLNNIAKTDFLSDLVKSMTRLLPGPSSQSEKVLTLSEPALISHLQEQLLEMQEPWTTSLLIHRALNTDSSYLTWHVCKTLGSQAIARSAEFLRWVGSRPDIEFENTSLHRVAAWALGEIGASQAAPLRRMLIEGSSSARAFAADALGQLKDTEAVPLLAKSLTEDDWNVALWAALSLSKIRDHAAVDAIYAAIRNEDGTRRYLAFDALVKIDRAAASAILVELGEDIAV